MTVVIGNDGACKLTMKLDLTTADLYTAYGVNIGDYRPECPMEDWVSLSVSKDTPEVSKLLTVPGTYIFKETINATAGNTTGSANVKVTYTLEDS
ncbi:unnamed protein product [marine sediment metagenome]|uniref:Uncharacterized protein n=1 Tax=marine sediment metagenome TaxID=412755 RepID=X1SX59_9ZZZZ